MSETNDTWADRIHPAWCVCCDKNRSDSSVDELQAVGWVRIGEGSYGWLCPECVRITDIINDGPVLTSSCIKESGSSPASVAPAGLETPEMTPDYCTTHEPPYYRIPDGATQLWHVIAALGMTHCQAMALKYVYRAGRKPGVAKADDLRKAVANLEYEITRLEKDVA